MKKIILMGTIAFVAIALAGCQTQKTTGGTTDNADSATLDNSAAGLSVETPPMPPDPAQTQ
jgi:uncharacterized lipoprotein YajG